ncbi:MAG: hypothetical protein O2816_16035 [Planctomycetota bacterium]|nr:hypothetical protein [Planctomycetota bacterium]
MQDDEKNIQEDAKAQAGAQATGAAAKLDLDNLDLTVETVEERISPSETNVFDK